MGHTANGNGGLVTGAGYPRNFGSSPLEVPFQSSAYARIRFLKKPRFEIAVATAELFAEFPWMLVEETACGPLEPSGSILPLTAATAVGCERVPSAPAAGPNAAP